MADFPINVIINPRGAQQGGRKVVDQLNKVDDRATRLQRSLRRVFAGFAAAFGVRQLVRLADEFTNIQNRLRVVTTGQAELASVTDELFRISNATRSEFQSTVVVYSRLAQASKQLGIEQKDLLQFTESLNQAVILSGASATEAKAGLIQFSQGIAAGALRGEELNSVLEQIPIVADVIAKQLGVTRGQLREMGAQGLITATDIIKSFQNAEEELREGFGKTVPTIGQSFVVLRNNILRFVGETDNAAGASAAFSRVILVVAKNVEILGRAVLATAVAFGTVYAAKAIPAAIRATQTLLGVFKALNVALVANPIGILVVALGAVIGILVAFADKINVGEGQFVSLGETAGAFIEELGSLLTELGQFVKDVFGGIADDFKDIIGQDFGGAFRSFVKTAARTVDAVLGIFNGLVAAIRELFLNTNFKFGASFKLTFGVIKRQGEIAFKKLANSIVDFFTDPLGFLARSFADLLGAISGGVAIARSLGLISEESRVSFEDQVTRLETLARQKAGADNPNLPYTKSDLQALDTELKQFVATQEAAILAAKAESPEQLLARVRAAFVGALAGGGGVEAFVDRVFARVDANVARRREEAKKAAQEIAAQEPPLSKRAQEVLDDIRKPMATLLADFEALQELQQRNKLTTDEFANAMDNLLLKGLKTATSLEAGFIRALAAIRLEARDFASVVEDVFTSVLSSAEDAIVEFVTTGKVSFRDFTNAILADLARIFARLLLIQGISLVFGGGAGTFIPSVVGAGAGAGTSAGVIPSSPSITPQPAAPVIVRQSAPNVTGGGTSSPMQLTVVNVQNDDEIPAALTTSAGDRFVVNTLGNNKKVARRALA